MLKSFKLIFQVSTSSRMRFHAKRQLIASKGELLTLPPLQSCDHMALCFLCAEKSDAAFSWRTDHRQHAHHDPLSVTAFKLRWVYFYIMNALVKQQLEDQLPIQFTYLSEFTIEVKHNETLFYMCYRSRCCGSAVWGSGVSTGRHSDAGLQHGSRAQHEQLHHVLVPTKPLRSSDGVSCQRVRPDCGTLPGVHWYIQKQLFFILLSCSWLTAAPTSVLPVTVTHRDQTVIQITSLTVTAGAKAGRSSGLFVFYTILKVLWCVTPVAPHHRPGLLTQGRLGPWILAVFKFYPYDLLPQQRSRLFGPWYIFMVSSQSSQWAGAPCSLRSLFLANRSGTQCGLLLL